MQLKPDTLAMTILLAFMTAIGPVTMDIYLASLPHISEALHTTAGAVQLTLSCYLLGFAVGQIFYGPLSDSFGRRPMLLLGFALYLVATCACALATSIEMLIIARVVQAIGAAGPIILARAIVRDLYEGTRAAKQLGLMSAIMGVTPIGGPVLGGFLQAAFGWRASFVATGLIGLTVATCAFWFLPETNDRKHTHALSARGILTSFGIVAQNKAYRSYLTLLTLNYIGVFAFLSAESHVLQKVFGLSSIQFGFTFALCSTSYIAGTASSTRLVSRLGIEGLIGLGKNLALAGGVLLVLGYGLFPDQFLAVIVPQMLYFLGTGLMVPSIMAGALTPFRERAGAASSLMGCVQMTAAAIVGAIMGALLGQTAWPLVSVMGLVAIVAFTVFRATTSARYNQPGLESHAPLNTEPQEFS